MQAACRFLRSSYPVSARLPYLAFASFPAPVTTLTTLRACSGSAISSVNQSINRRLPSTVIPWESARRFASTTSTDADGETPLEETGDGAKAEHKSQGVPEYDPKDRTRLIEWTTSVKYMKSEAYRATYGNDPVWKSYRRQHKGQIPKPYTRRSCIWAGRISTGSPCPACRDEYLVFDYRHTELLKQFVSPQTGERLNLHVIGLCQRKRQRLDLELEKAKLFGTMVFKVPFRRYDYDDYVGEAKTAPGVAAGH
ncbi:putative 28S ribosomal protein S18b, mitochondrial [Hypsibius exemplaris]|uniref:Small ribosomal subunit protein mS40 n=1 Tax=Hypsibius exemplaris TaxID=2072580 RepID=A0A9X6RJM1_HYPEX|nr:putative 28S ribosomal protein S18b, mitochondrial [Hypsibius exemplaris]